MINLNLDLCKLFTGGVSLSEASVRIALESSNKNIETPVFLEIGGGMSTKIFNDILRTNYKSYIFNCIENNKEYCYYDLPNVNYINYDLPRKFVDNHKDKDVFNYIDKVDLTHLPKADFISIDGPDGIARARWYSKLGPVVKSGTIILIDDYDHYTEFGTELNRNLGYSIITEFCNDSRFLPPDAIHAKNFGSRPIQNDDKHYNKTFKIVEVR